MVLPCGKIYSKGLENVFCIVDKSFKFLTLSVSPYCRGLLRRWRGTEHYGSVPKKGPEKQVLYLRKAVHRRSLKFKLYRLGVGTRFFWLCQNLMRNQSVWVPGGLWSQGCNIEELTEGHHKVRILPFVDSRKRYPSYLCPDLVSFPVLSQIKPQDPHLVVPFRQFL